MLDPVQLPNQRKPGKQRSLSYFRRQEKRKLAQSSAAASKKEGNNVPKVTTNNEVPDLVNNAEEAVIVDHTQQAAAASENKEGTDVPKAATSPNISRTKDAGKASRSAEADNNVGLHISRIKIGSTSDEKRSTKLFSSDWEDEDLAELEGITSLDFNYVKPCLDLVQL